MAGFHDITAAVIGAGFIGPVHVEGLRRRRHPREGHRRHLAGGGSAGGGHAWPAARVPSRGRAPGRSGGAERAPRLAESAAPRARAGRARGRQARHLREAAGDDVGADDRAREGLARAAVTGGGRQLQPALLSALDSRPLARAKRRDRPGRARARQLRAGLAALPHRLQLARAEDRGRRAACRRRHRHALARSRRVRQRARGRGRDGRPDDRAHDAADAPCRLSRDLQGQGERPARGAASPCRSTPRISE